VLPSGAPGVLAAGSNLASAQTPGSCCSTTLSTHVATQLEQVDAVLLVDNAKQPMQAAPVAALKSIAVSGNAMKLHLPDLRKAPLGNLSAEHASTRLYRGRDEF